VIDLKTYREYGKGTGLDRGHGKIYGIFFLPDQGPIWYDPKVAPGSHHSTTSRRRQPPRPHPGAAGAGCVARRGRRHRLAGDRLTEDFLPARAP
jgi:hypothetical protein